MSECKYLELEIKLAGQNSGVIIRPTFEGYSRQDNPEYSVKVEYSVANKSIISGRRINKSIIGESRIVNYIPQLFEIKVFGISKEEADALRLIYLAHAKSLTERFIKPIVVIDRFEPLVDRFRPLVDPFDPPVLSNLITLSETTYNTTGTIAIKRDYSRWSASMILFEIDPPQLR
jgi:hypothetical protein